LPSLDENLSKVEECQALNCSSAPHLFSSLTLTNFGIWTE